MGKKLFAVLFVTAILLMLCASCSARVMREMNKEACKNMGELRRNFNCVAVRHTMADVCCWMKRDGSYGHLPYKCCGTGWESSDCEGIINTICEKPASM